ncbi:hypothetical protein CEXT_414991 [Caerostris extrusa]|uniref:Uncharacterized protein n=1 Tax=Caerostris extrusa TaxID=172846 RepID=A0AAV4MY77_CAEEX|nr:hypothetical protein CEXT_414991 [Caerostris extrusa]
MAGSVNASKPVEHLGSSGDTVTEGYAQTSAAFSVSSSSIDSFPGIDGMGGRYFRRYFNFKYFRGCNRNYRETKRLKSASLIKAGSVNASKPVEHLRNFGDTVSVTEGYVQTLAVSSVSATSADSFCMELMGWQIFGWEIF